jgi:large subunit ribosomal protein L25
VFFFYRRATQEQSVMAETVVLTAQTREGRGTRRAEKLRKQGQIPAVLYGHKEATVSLSLSRDEFARVLRQGARVVDLQAGGKTEKALIRDVQWDHLGHDVLHVDFARVSAHERIQIEVRLEIRGQAPGVTAGGILDQALHTIEVECPALSPPESIRVNVGELQLDQSIYVRDLKLPEGVTAVTDPDAVVVHVTPPVAEPAAPAAPVEAGTAEPEVIGRKAAEGEEGE